MDLRKPAAWFETTEFDIYDEALATWTASGLTGKIMPADRFLSNFNRPTRRRSLGLPPETAVPASNTIRVPSTGEIYFIGALRQDAQGGYAYDKIGILHRSETLGTVNRRAPVGPSNNPGWLVETVVASHYMDVELRSTSEVDEQKQQFEGDFFVAMPPHATPQAWDRLSIGGEDYMVELTYADSGFKFVRAIKRQDHRQDFVYHSRSAAVDYDPATGVVTDGLVNYNVTGFAMDDQLGDSNTLQTKESRLVITVEQAHIGVVPTTEDELTWNSQRRRVMRVDQDFLNQQYHLHCTL